MTERARVRHISLVQDVNSSGRVCVSNKFELEFVRQFDVTSTNMADVIYNMTDAQTSLVLNWPDSFVYTTGHCRRWRSRMEVKVMAGSLFVHWKIAYFYSVTAEKWLTVSLPNFVTIRRTHFSIWCRIFSWIRSTKLKIQAMEFCDFIKDSVSPSGLFVPCSLTVTST